MEGSGVVNITGQVQDEVVRCYRRRVSMTCRDLWCLVTLGTGLRGTGWRFGAQLDGDGEDEEEALEGEAVGNEEACQEDAVV